MPNIINDRRTDEQRSTHTTLIGGRDKFLSGWGEGIPASYAYWACWPEHADDVAEWVAGRGDITRITTHEDEPPRRAGHVSVYTVEPGHPALMR